MTTFTARTDRTLVRAAASSTRHILLTATAPKRPDGESKPRPPVSIAFVLDRSGSMSGDKIELAKAAVDRAITGLAPEDRFAIVTYDDRIETICRSQRATDKHKADARLALAHLNARGSTNLHDGWMRGADLLRTHLAPEGVNRVLLLTDGLANRGVIDPDSLAQAAMNLRRDGIGTSTFGVGADFDERLLTSIADAGGGHFYFIAHAQQISDFITSELGELLEVVARDVTVDVMHHPALVVEPLSPVGSVDSGPGSLRIGLGDLVAEQQVEIVLRVRFPEADAGVQTTAFFTIADRDGALQADGCTLSWEHASHAANDEQPRDRDVDRAVARVHAARARLEAVRLNRHGDYAAARRAVRGVARRIGSYAADDAELNALTNALSAEEAAFAAPMPEMSRKSRYFAAANVQRSRDLEGKARRY